MRLLACLGGLWSVTGNFPRFLAMADLAERVLVGWEPPPELEEPPTCSPAGVTAKKLPPNAVTPSPFVSPGFWSLTNV